MRARARTHIPGKMNQLEERYSWALELRKRAGELHDWRFEPFKFRLADRTFYEFDFWLIYADGFMDIHEVKGHWEDDARVKTKVAAEQFPQFRFFGITWERGAWVYEVFNG